DGDKGLDQQIGLDVLQLDVFEVGVAELDHFFILPVIQGGGEVHLFHRFQIVNAAGQEDGGTASGNQKQGGGQHEEPPFFPHAFPPQFPHQLELSHAQTAPPFRFPCTPISFYPQTASAFSHAGRQNPCVARKR